MSCTSHKGFLKPLEPQAQPLSSEPSVWGSVFNEVFLPTKLHFTAPVRKERAAVSKNRAVRPNTSSPSQPLKATDKNILWYRLDPFPFSFFTQFSIILPFVNNFDQIQCKTLDVTFVHYMSFSWRFDPKWLTIMLRSYREQFRVKCLSQGHID